MKGRKPQPTALKLARGNPGKRPLPASEPKFTSAAGEPPAWLSDGGRAIWFRVVPELKSLGLLTRVDEESLATYCEASDVFARASKQLQVDGLTIVDPQSGAMKKHPAATVASAAAATIRQFAAEFGFSPSARVRLKTPEAPASDPLGDFIRGNTA